MDAAETVFSLSKHFVEEMRILFAQLLVSRLTGHVLFRADPLVRLRRLPGPSGLGTQDVSDGV
jgi:hypothetical protein